LNVAEGTAHPLIDLEWFERFLTPTKVGAYMSLTDEAIADVVSLKSVVNDTLRKQHDIRVEKDVYFGDGTGANSTGATIIATTFNAGAMATAVSNPTLVDAVNAVIVDIASKRNYVDETPYIANISFVSPLDFFLNFTAKKDANGLPMYPNANMFQKIKIGPTEIVPTFRMPNGKLFVADMKKYHVVKKEVYKVKIGVINDDLIKGKQAIVANSRYYAYVKELDKIAFVYDDIDTIITAIKKV
jgi:hypothetical protein